MASFAGEPTASPETLAEFIVGITGVPVDPDELRRALTHRSYAYENGSIPNNERLEFLGDSVLGLVITDALFNQHPDVTEGQLAKLRSAVVNMRALAEVARTIGLGDHVYLGRGEETTGGRDKSSILADTVEAVIGAVYRGSDIATATVFVRHLFDPMIAHSARLGAGLDWKTSLQEISAELGIGSPTYLMTDSGPDHEKEFVATAVVAEEALGSGRGRSKKEAEQQAAAEAWEILSGRRDNA